MMVIPTFLLPFTCLPNHGLLLLLIANSLVLNVFSIGNVATGDLNFTSTERHVIPTTDPLPQQSNSEQSTQNTLGINFVGTNPFAQAEVTEARSTPCNLNIEDRVGGNGPAKNANKNNYKVNF